MNGLSNSSKRKYHNHLWCFLLFRTMFLITGALPTGFLRCSAEQLHWVPSFRSFILPSTEFLRKYTSYTNTTKGLYSLQFLPASVNLLDHLLCWFQSPPKQYAHVKGRRKKKKINLPFKVLSDLIFSCPFLTLKIHLQ